MTLAPGVVFGVMIFLSIFVNFDGGGLPPILDKLEESLGVDPAQQGMLGGFVYVGLTIACPIVGPLFSRFSPRLVVVSALTLNTFFCFLFAMSQNAAWAFVARFGVGFTQSAFVIYNPVWIDCHAPEQYRTTWLSLFQASCPVGIMVGYMVSGYMVQVFGFPWQTAFYIQAFCLIPPTIFMLFCPSDILSIDGLEDTSDLLDESHIPSDTRPRGRSAAMVVIDGMSTVGASSKFITAIAEDQQHTPSSPHHTAGLSPSPQPRSPQSPQAPSAASTTADAVYAVQNGEMHTKPHLARHTSVPFIKEKHAEGEEDVEDISLVAQFLVLWKNKLFVWIVFALSGLYFVVTSIQYWITVFLIKDIGAPEGAVLSAFAATSLTAPTSGVILGGLAIDYLGGYRQYRTCCMVLSTWAFLAFCFSVPVGFVRDFPTIIGLLWVTLFFGGCILAPATGIIISVVEPSHRPYASSISMLICNLLGFALGPILTGLVYQYYGLTWCVRATMGWGAIGVCGMLVATFISPRKPYTATPVPDCSLPTPRTLPSSLDIGEAVPTARVENAAIM